MQRRMDGLRPKLADFGLTRAAVEQLSDELQRGASSNRDGSRDSRDRPREVSLRRTETPGTGFYMAPEILQRTKSKSAVTTKADVYSFSLILWEMVSPRVDLAEAWEAAAHGRPAIAVVVPVWAKQGIRPAIPSGCEAHWQHAIEQCWQTRPDKRPSFRQVAARFFSDDASARIEIWRESAADTGLTDVQRWLHEIGLGRCAAPAGDSLA